MMSTVFHPQMDGQLERTIQILEDMLRACVLNINGCWDEHLPLVEFANHKNYHASVQMAPSEELYGRPLQSSVCWTEVGERPSTGPILVRDTFEENYCRGILMSLKVIHFQSIFLIDFYLKKIDLCQKC